MWGMEHTKANQFLSRTHDAPVSIPLRMASAVVAQTFYNPVCPLSDHHSKSVKDKLVLLTGGNVGIGLETARGLFQRGAKVIIASRSHEVSQAAIAEIRGLQPSSGDGSIESIPLDLSDLDSVVQMTKDFQRMFPSRKIDVLIQNAGVWPSQHKLSAQGFEIAFAVNALGHHLLMRRLQCLDLLAANARMIVVTGDIYIMANDCTHDFSYADSDGCQMAYCRSKLAVNWLFFQFHLRHPEFLMVLVHPGVISTNLTGESQGVVNALKQLLLCNAVQGAQTSLICATAPAEDLESGAYYHNTCGKMRLRDTDPALNSSKAEEMWAFVEAQCHSYLSL